MRAPDVLETTWYGLEDGDGVVALGILAWVRIQVSGECEDDEHKRVAQHRQEEEQALAAGCTLSCVGEAMLDQIQDCPKC